MSKEKPTFLERGIKVQINQNELDLLVKANDERKVMGFLCKEFYPDEYKEMTLENEVGRFNIFRLFLI